MEKILHSLSMSLNRTEYALALERIVLIQSDALESIARINDCISDNNPKIDRQIQKYKEKIDTVKNNSQCDVV